jgi:hypothetical protein
VLETGQALPLILTYEVILSPSLLCFLLVPNIWAQKYGTQIIIVIYSDMLSGFYLKEQ